MRGDEPLPVYRPWPAPPTSAAEPAVAVAAGFAPAQEGGNLRRLQARFHRAGLGGLARLARPLFSRRGRCADALTSGRRARNLASGRRHSRAGRHGRRFRPSGGRSWRRSGDRRRGRRCRGRRRGRGRRRASSLVESGLQLLAGVFRVLPIGDQALRQFIEFGRCKRLGRRRRHGREVRVRRLVSSRQVLGIGRRRRVRVVLADAGEVAIRLDRVARAEPEHRRCDQCLQRSLAQWPTRAATATTGSI